MTVILFFAADVFVSLNIRHYLMKKDPLLIVVIAGYIYNALLGALYLYLAQHKGLAKAPAITELYSTLLPGSLIFCFCMFFFHLWAFASGLRTYPGKYKDLD
ncbi:hypothetical protein KSS93_25055 [Pseudomonas xanthosomatis]|uniref:hypothetical protein n=1 Tax=Pseudomonas xanthosomatis TaxID=2842356 RepID=UPI001C3CB37F|nr:hypothetical protein [Pseudomonas xanthosomatis]QXH46095.1 hypothetical protein KSS93_25055 [Pseudomonas xanthosomatis]